MFKEAWFADDEWVAERGFNSSPGTKGVLRKSQDWEVALPETPPDAVEEHPQNNCHADAESWRDWSHFSTIFSSLSFALASVL